MNVHSISVPFQVLPGSRRLPSSVETKSIQIVLVDCSDRTMTWNDLRELLVEDFPFQLLVDLPVGPQVGTPGLNFLYELLLEVFQYALPARTLSKKFLLRTSNKTPFAYTQLPLSFSFPAIHLSSNLWFRVLPIVRFQLQLPVADPDWFHSCCFYSYSSFPTLSSIPILSSIPTIPTLSPTPILSSPRLAITSPVWSAVQTCSTSAFCFELSYFFF